MNSEFENEVNVHVSVNCSCLAYVYLKNFILWNTVMFSVGIIGFLLLIMNIHICFLNAIWVPFPFYPSPGNPSHLWPSFWSSWFQIKLSSPPIPFLLKDTIRFASVSVQVARREKKSYLGFFFLGGIKGILPNFPT